MQAYICPNFHMNKGWSCGSLEYLILIGQSQHPVVKCLCIMSAKLYNCSLSLATTASSVLHSLFSHNEIKFKKKSIFNVYLFYLFIKFGNLFIFYSKCTVGLSFFYKISPIQTDTKLILIKSHY